MTPEFSQFLAGDMTQPLSELIAWPWCFWTHPSASPMASVHLSYDCSVPTGGGHTDGLHLVWIILLAITKSKHKHPFIYSLWLMKSSHRLQLVKFGAAPERQVDLPYSLSILEMRKLRIGGMIWPSQGQTDDNPQIETLGQADSTPSVLALSQINTLYSNTKQQCMRADFSKVFLQYLGPILLESFRELLRSYMRWNCGWVTAFATPAVSVH